MPIADAEHRDAAVQYGGIDVGTAGFVDAGWAAGDDHTLARTKDFRGSFAGLYVGEHTQFAHFACDEVGILATRVEHRDLGIRSR